MKLLRVGLVLCLALYVVSGVTAGDVDFTADVTKTQGEDSVTKGTLHVKGDLYRMAFPDPRGPETVYIADPKNDVVHVLVPRYKLYMEDKASGQLAQMQDPFLMRAMLLKHYEAKEVGKETISGYECAKEEIGRDGQVAATLWKSTKLGFHLKVYLQETYHTVVTNVKEGAVDEALMKVPEGYTKADRETIMAKVEADPEMQAKAEAWEKNRPRKVEITQNLSEGTEATFLLGTATKVTAGPKYGAEGCKWHLEAHLGADVLEAGKEALVGKVEKTWDQDGKVPDRLVVKCAAGRCFFGVKLIGKLPLILAKKAVSTQKAMGGPSWSVPHGVKLTTLRLTMAAEAEGKVHGILDLSDGKGKRDKREFTLSPGESKLFEFPVSEGWGSIGYTIQTGEVTVEHVEDYREEKDRKPF